MPETRNTRPEVLNTPGYPSSPPVAMDTASSSLSVMSPFPAADRALTEPHPPVYMGPLDVINQLFESPINPHLYSYLEMRADNQGRQTVAYAEITEPGPRYHLDGGLIRTRVGNSSLSYLPAYCFPQPPGYGSEFHLRAGDLRSFGPGIIVSAAYIDSQGVAHPLPQPPKLSPTESFSSSASSPPVLQAIAASQAVGVSSSSGVSLTSNTALATPSSVRSQSAPRVFMSQQRGPVQGMNRG